MVTAVRRTQKAVKAHRCAVCGKQVEPGETYYRIKGLWEKEWQNWGAHTVCLDIYHDGSGEQEITELSWRELVEIASTAEELEAFVARFPPKDDEDGAIRPQRVRADRPTQGRITRLLRPRGQEDTQDA